MKHSSNTFTTLLRVVNVYLGSKYELIDGVRARLQFAEAWGRDQQDLDGDGGSGHWEGGGGYFGQTEVL